MNRRQINGLLRVAFWVCAIAVLVLSLAPITASMPSTGWDKTNHLLAFATLVFLGHGAYRGRTVTVLAGLLAYGGLVEILQSFTPDRSAEWSDLLADGVGLLLGEMLTWLAWRRTVLRSIATGARRGAVEVSN